MRTTSPNPFNTCKTAPLAAAALAVFLIVFPSNSLYAAIPETEWRDLSDKDMSPLGKAALSLDKELWKHAESDHFVYHYTDAKEAEMLYKASEIYYLWVKDMFGVETDQWKKKGQIFIFETEDQWKAFKKKVKTEMTGDAFTNGWELFIYRNPFWLAPKKTLAHELTHVIVFRFLDGPIPLFLNEGFAEFISYKAMAMHADGDEYRVRKMTFMDEKDFTSLDALISTRDYPKDKEELFYQESELFVRHLILGQGSKKFYAFMKSVSGGEDVQDALKTVYGFDLEDFEKKFHHYALTGK